MSKVSSAVKRPLIKSAERVVFITGGATVTLVLAVASFKQLRIDWVSYAPIFIYGIISFFSLGLLCRWRNVYINLSNVLIAMSGSAVICISLNALNNLATPLVTDPYDAYIARIDGALGFYWPDLMVWASDHPDIVAALRFVYDSAGNQIVLCMVLLGLFGKERALERFMLVLTISAVLVVSFWTIFPTLGAKCFYNLPTEVWHKLDVTVDQNYRDTMLAMARDGISIVSPDEFRGMIAFPSYHMTLAMVVMMAASSFRYLFLPVVAFNLFVIPATWIHGGHHMLDFVGGAILFYISFHIAEWTLVRLSQSAREPRVKSRPEHAPVSPQYP